jgi:hypothetical protein
LRALKKENVELPANHSIYVDKEKAIQRGNVHFREKSDDRRQVNEWKLFVDDAWKQWSGLSSELIQNKAKLALTSA